MIGLSLGLALRRHSGSTGSATARLSDPDFALQDYADALSLGADGYTWAQGNPMVVDRYGNIVALRQKHGAGIRFAF
jgi:hypothetical protein